VKTHAKAVDYMAAHPDDVVAGVSKTFGVDQAVVKLAVNNIWPSWKISDDYKKQLENTVSQMVKFKQIEQPVELTTLVDDSFISKLS
jgi:ABC-type nitrate/sulfonate/bicarbonate transport system substrate-binding protein